MKANLKGLGGIKGLLLLHGEKVAMATVGLLALWFIYSSLRLPRLEEERQATKLTSEASQTTEAVNRSEWPNDPTDPRRAEVRVAINIEKTGGEFLVPSDAYRTSRDGFNPRKVTPAVFRTDPVMLNAVDVHVVGGTGIFAFIDEAVRQARALADAERQEKEQVEQRRDAERMADEGQGEGRGLRGRGPGGAYGEAGEMPFDPEHPKRRPVDAMAQPAGVPLQGDERQERVHWAVITAKVPVREQLKLYQDAFENARGYDPARDFPHYAGYKVQRAEVIPGQPLEWTDVKVYDGQRKSVETGDDLGTVVSSYVLNVAKKGGLYARIAQFWPPLMEDVVDQRYLVDVLALPLPPLVGRNWGSDATHPDIPLLEDTPALEDELMPLEDEQPTEELAADSDEDAQFRSDPTQALGPSGYGGERSGLGGPYGGGGRDRGYGNPYGRGGGERGYGPYGGGAGRGRAYGMGGERGGIGPYGREGRGGYGGMGGGVRAGNQPTTLPRGVDFWLLRFFDFSVEPGKKYKYRVRLVLSDPNMGQGIEKSMLAPAVQDRLAKLAQMARTNNKPISQVRYIDDWSAPSRTVGIPIAGSVKLAEAKPTASGRVSDEPTVKLLVESFEVDASGNAIQAEALRDFRRGYVANFVEKDQKYLGPGGVWIDELESFNFFTGMTVVDMNGGEALGKDATAPARVLIMDPAGELHIRSEMDDKEAVANHKLIFEQDKRRDREGEMGSPYGPRGGGVYGPPGGGNRSRGS
jgi:hypothetical protein